jgi:hypothetical protein
VPLMPQEPCGGCAPEVGNPSERVEGDGCHKKGVAHHGEQSVRHANSSLRDAYFSTEPHVGHVCTTSLLHVGRVGVELLVWTWVGHRDGLTC